MTQSQHTHLPRVFLISGDPRHQHDLGNVLSPYFSITQFDDIKHAIDEFDRNPPKVVVVDQNTRRDQSTDMFLEHANRLEGKCPGLVVLAGKDDKFHIKENHLDTPSQFLNWPFAGKALLNAISDVIGRKAQSSWTELPDVQSRSLTMTVEEYQGISDAIANGEPIDYNSASESCSTLTEAVDAGQHHAILSAVQSHHNYTYVHSMRVATLLTLFGYGLGMRGDDLLILSTGGLIHDVGKLVTPEQILDKPGKLTEEEWPVMRDHVTRSSQLLDGSDDVTKGALIIAGQHHEKIDGSGYPKGLKGGELNELARMSAIVDIFGALTDCRSYKPSFPKEKAFGILESMEKSIDQTLLKVFRSIFEPGSEIVMEELH